MITDGAFSIPSYTTPSATGVEADDYFDVRLEDWSGNGSSSNWDTGTSADYYINSSRDNEVPTATSFLHSDTNRNILLSEGVPLISTRLLKEVQES